MNIIEINHLTKSYGRSRGIDDLTLRVQQGDIFGFIGPNGAGKSTTIRILLNLIFPTSGNAAIFELDVVLDSKKIRSRTGYVPSDASMYDRMKVVEFLKFGAAFYGAETNVSRINYLLDLFDLDPTRKIPELSMGNKKKVSIIQALIHKPELLILDEPLVGLDPHGRQELKDIILDQKSRGTSVFFCSHILSDAEKICDRIGILCESRLLCSGRLDELLSETGSKLHVNPGHDDIAKEMLSAATETIKRPDGGWELSFLKEEETTQALLATKAKYGDAVTITSFRESLEDFFFRKIENATKSS